MADLGVHRVRKVYGGGAAWKRLHVALRREDVDVVREEVDLDALVELLRIGDFLLELHELAQPNETGCVLRIDASGVLLVLPVRCNPVLGGAVHLVSPNLNLHTTVAGPDHRRVQRLVHVRLRKRDVVLEAPGNGRPFGVNDAQRGVAVGNALRDHPEGDEVVHLLESDAAGLHLAM